MIQGIDNTNNKQKIALVVVGYNRLSGLRRLLESLLVADFGAESVPLVISIDCSGNEELYTYVRNFAWPHGEKYLNIQKTRLGLKDHIYQCGDLTRYFKAIALFEDDLWVSPHFYNYLTQAVERYGGDERICQISLYRNERLGNSGFYFDTLHDGSDCFLWQDICTWGECWTEQMWKSFREWLLNHDEDYVNQVDMPDMVKKWTRAWSKYYIAYELDTKKHVLFPHESLTTNFDDAGGEHGSLGNAVQVNVLHGKRNYQFREFEEMVRYDFYCNNESISEWLPRQLRGETVLDLYGGKSSYQGKRYVLSMLKLPYKVVEEWGLKMRPLELNILYNIKGEGIRLYDTSISEPCKVDRKKPYTNPTVGYFLRGFSLALIAGYLRDYYKNRVGSLFRKRK